MFKKNVLKKIFQKKNSKKKFHSFYKAMNIIKKYKKNFKKNIKRPNIIKKYQYKLRMSDKYIKFKIAGAR